MAPEQARGELKEIDLRTDVFGLGAILYEILTTFPPYVGKSPREVLALAQKGVVVPPGGRVNGRPVPKLLEEICVKALSSKKDDRYQDAGKFHRALQDYLEGIDFAERRAAEAGGLLWTAEKLRERLQAAERREAALCRREAELRARLNDHDPEEEKRPLWELLAKGEAARETVASEFSRTTAAYVAVLSIAPDHRQARSRLAELFYGRLLAAEERGDRETASIYKSLVLQYHDGYYDVELTGKGNLRLESSPPGATVLLCRFEERGLIFEESAQEPIGATPLEISVPQGSYLAILWKEGFAEARYPLVIDRGKLHAGRVRLVPEGTIPEGFVQVPGGVSLVGTDTAEFPGLERRRLEIGEVFVKRSPVTFGEYCEFLTDRYPAAKAPPAELQAFFGREEYIVRDGEGFCPVGKLDPRMAVTAVTRRAALEYAAWLGERLARKVRLLTEEEWERCARGADGRLYPWGNKFDWALAKGAFSRAGEPFPDPVGSFPRDMSVFGVCDLAGTVRELCEGWAGEGYRPCRGGSWYNPFPVVFRADVRTRQRDGNRTTDVGFRVCYDEAIG
jgi:serine/threonine-protein kinase